MAIPDFQTLMLPVVRQFADGTKKRSRDVRVCSSTSLRLRGVRSRSKSLIFRLAFFPEVAEATLFAPGTLRQ